MQNAQEKEISQRASRLHLLLSLALLIGMIAFVYADYATRPWPLFVHMTQVRLWFMSLMLAFTLAAYFDRVNEVVLGYINTLSVSFYISYTYLISSQENIPGVTNAFTMLYMVVSFALLWHWKNHILLASIGVGFHLLMVLNNVSFDYFVFHSGIWNLIVPFLSTFVVYFRYQTIYREIQLRLEITARNEQIMKQSEELQAQNQKIEQQSIVLQKSYHQITESIRYARRIQLALMPPQDSLEKHFEDHFIAYRPKDLISGDFYWVSREVATPSGRFVFVAAADCTGHGIPAGFMTVVCLGLLDKIINDECLSSPAQILKQLDKRLEKILHQEMEGIRVRDGMDLCLVRFDFDKSEVVFAGARRPLWHGSGGNISIHRGNSFPIGDTAYRNKRFTEMVIPFAKGDVFYLHSDGMADQFGPEGKFMSKRMLNLLTSCMQQPMQTQEQILINRLDEWSDQSPQTDDWLMIGVRV
jgi:serine phosphatase RsbU (regulator of sigma subunit)